MGDKSISIDELVRLCKDYDESYHSWPEHEYEGKAVLEYILEELKFGQKDIEKMINRGKNTCPGGCEI